MRRFIGKFEDLNKIRSKSYNGNSRYFCPYCDTINGKTPDEEGCVIWNHKKQSGYCFRCNTLITHDGLPDIEYIKSKLIKEEENPEDQLLKIDWLQSIEENKEVLDYMHSRYISTSTLKKFNVKACSDPLDGVVFINKVIDNDYTDFMQARFINSTEFKHAFLKDLNKKLCWLHLCDSNDLIVCEGFTDGLSAYQHSDYTLNPIILGGKTITNFQIDELKEFCNEYKNVNITVCMDGGFFEDTLKVANKIYQNCYNTIIHVMPMPFNKDLNEINSLEYKKYFNKRLLFEPSKIQYIRNQIYN